MRKAAALSAAFFWLAQQFFLVFRMTTAGWTVPSMVLRVTTVGWTVGSKNNLI